MKSRTFTSFCQSPLVKPSQAVANFSLNSSVFSPERANYYRCLQTLLLLAQEEDRQPLQYLNAFVRMYGADAVEAASAAISGEAAFYGLQPVDSDLHAFAAHQSLLKAYEKLQRAKAAFWAK
jgi:ribosomal protein S12 methylthiotransferase accessory factor